MPQHSNTFVLNRVCSYIILKLIKKHNVQLLKYSVENRSKLTSDLDISDQLLLILQDYDEESKRLASKLLCFLCSEEKIRIEMTNLDGVQVLLRY